MSGARERRAETIELILERAIRLERRGGAQRRPGAGFLRVYGRCVRGSPRSRRAPCEAVARLIDETPNLDWLFLTKRPQNVKRLAPWAHHWPENVWLGATAENQRWLDRRMPHLISLNARVLFLYFVSPCLDSWTFRNGSTVPSAANTDVLTGSSVAAKVAITRVRCILNGSQPCETSVSPPASSSTLSSGAIGDHSRKTTRRAM